MTWRHVRLIAFVLLLSLIVHYGLKGSYRFVWWMLE